MKAPLLPKISLPGRLGLALSSVLAIVAGFALASVLFVVLLVAGLVLGGWLWWQYRRLIGRTTAAPVIIEGEYAVVPEHPALEDRRIPSAGSPDGNTPTARRAP